MSNSVIGNEEYIILLKYFDGDVRKLDKAKVKSLNDGQFNGKEIEKVDKKILKTFAKIIKLKKENPTEYRKTKWSYPDWKDDEEEVLKRLKEKFPEEYKDEAELLEEEWEEEEEEGLEEVKNIEEVYRSIIPQRKAFIEWVNDVFYKELLDNHKGLKDELAEINIYQYSTINNI